jgi:hypothetical protein
MSVYKRVMPDWYTVRTEAALRANTIEESTESLMSWEIRESYQDYIDQHYHTKTSESPQPKENI